MRLSGPAAGAAAEDEVDRGVVEAALLVVKPAVRTNRADAGFGVRARTGQPRRELNPHVWPETFSAGCRNRARQEGKRALAKDRQHFLRSQVERPAEMQIHNQAVNSILGRQCSNKGPACAVQLRNQMAALLARPYLT